MKSPEVDINPIDRRPSLIWSSSSEEVAITLKSMKELRLLRARIDEAIEADANRRYGDAPEA
jgi:hypothetical protein